MIFRNFFKRKITAIGLEQAFKNGFLTEEEYLRLVASRADKKLEDFLNKSKKKKK